MRIKAVAAGALLVLLPSSKALAQIPIAPPVTEAGSTQSIDEARKAAKIHVGPLYVAPALQLKELGVDTNVFNEADNPRQDFTFTLTPQANIAVPVARRGLIRTSAAADVVYYQKYSTERSLDPQFTVRGEMYARRLTLFAEDAYLNTRQRPNYEIDVRSRHLQNDITAGVDLGVTPRTSVELSVQKGRIRFDGDTLFLGNSLAETLNRDSEGGTVALRHRLTALTTIGARYERLRERFPLSPLRDTNSFRIMPGVEFKPRALIKGFAYVGFRSFTPLSPLLPDYRGLVSQLGLAYTLLGATTFGVTYDRDITYSYEQATPYYLDNSVGVFVRRAVGGKWDVMATAARHHSDYSALTLPGTQPLGQRVDTTDSYGASLGYRLKRDTRVGFGAAYYTRTSVATLKNYNGLRVGTTVTYGF
jgi:hypothetical protein